MQMKKSILNILICIVFFFFIISVLWYFNGSLEMYPTDEQHGKARIAAGLLSVLNAIIGVLLVLLKRKIAKQEKK